MMFKSIESLEENSNETILEVTLVLMKLVDNILLYPSNPKYRKLRLANAVVTRLIIPTIGAMECLFEIGFEEGDDSLLLPPERTSVERLTRFRNEISSIRSKYLAHNSNSPGTGGGGADAATTTTVITTTISTSTTTASTITNTTTTTTTPISTAANNDSNNMSTRTNNTSYTNNNKARGSGTGECSVRPNKKTLEPVHVDTTDKPDPPLIQKMFTLSERVMQYEDKNVIDKALSLIPLDLLNITIQKRMRALQAEALKRKEPLNEASAHEMLYLLEVMTWFKNDFFKWVDAPECVSCYGNTKLTEVKRDPDPKYPSASRVEVYSCKNCHGGAVFPRFNDVKLLLDSRKGRCGEWAQTFTCICRALGWDARYISDETDHAWTEVFLKSEQRWIHCDPCECELDKPLLYEKGWKKKLTYILAFSCDGVQDVTWRYTADHVAIRARRTLCSESELSHAIQRITEKRQRNLSAMRRKHLAHRTVIELVEFLSPSKDVSNEEYGGRKSGSLLWRLQRGETDVSSRNTNFIWRPSLEEVACKTFIVQYSVSKDEYKRGNNEIIKRWQDGVYSSENVFRKEEFDWKYTYLCRTVGSESGKLAWKFDVSESGMIISEVEVVCKTDVFENGQVSWLACSEETCIKITPGESVYITRAFEGSQDFTLTAHLSGGKGENPWQHSQLFRQRFSDISFPFQVTIKLKENV